MNTLNTASPSNVIDGAANRAHRAVDRATESVTPTIDRAASAAHRTIDKAAQAAVPAAEWMSSSKKQITSKSSEVADACGTYVREHPIMSIAGALAIGYAAGKIMR